MPSLTLAPLKRLPTCEFWRRAFAATLGCHHSSPQWNLPVHSSAGRRPECFEKMPGQVEILVHVSGPSCGRDDARYRKEAKAFLGFDVAERQCITTLNTDCEGQGSRSSTLLTESDRRDTIDSTPSLSPSRRIQSIRQLFQAKHRLSTPAVDASANLLRRPLTWQDAISTSPWTSVKETPWILHERTPAVSRSHNTVNVRTGVKRSSGLRRANSESWETPPSVIPDSQPLHEHRVMSSPIAKKIHNSSSSFEEPKSSPIVKRVRRNPTVTRDVVTPLPKVPASFSDMRPLGPSPSQRTLSSQNSEPSLPQTIVPKTKPVFGNAKFTSHKTKYLRCLARLPAVQAAKISCVVSRPVDKLERGHWRISLSTWSTGAKIKFWKFLTDFIGAGKAGCVGHVYCIWEKSDKPAGSCSEKENQRPGNEEIALIYCWGEVVFEIFLVIYMAGGNEVKVKGMDASWIDAAGTSVGSVTGLYLNG